MTQFYSRTDTVYNGGEAIFSFSFSYIKKEDIHVFIDDVETSEWEWLNASQIKVTAPLETGVTVSVRRITPIQDKIVTYENMSMILDDDNLNLSQDQLLNATQELYDNSEQFTIDVEKELNAKIQANKDLIDQNKIDTDKQISDNNDAINARQDAFEVKLNEDIKEVADAADKINQLDESIKLCVDSANNAQTSANNATASAEAAKQAAEDAKKYKNKTITVLKNPINDGYYLEGNENANTIYNYVYGDKTSVELAFDDIITNTGEQIYPFETFDKDRNAIFRRNIITKDKVERINIKVDYQGTVTFEPVQFEAGSGMPVGTIFAHTASDKFVPENSLPCDGTEYTKEQFPTLYTDWLNSKDYFDKSKIDVVGSPTITNDGIASSMNNKNYLKLPYINLNGKNNLTIEGSFVLSKEDMNKERACIIGCEDFGIVGNEKKFLPMLLIKNGFPYLMYNTGAGDWARTDSTHKLSPNIKYQFKYEITKEKVNLYINNILDTSVNAWTTLLFKEDTAGNLTIGSAPLFAPFKIDGSIDLKQFSISVDGKEVYSPTIGKLETCTYEEYQQEIAATGECLKWGIDTANGKFKVPTKLNEYVSPNQTKLGVVGNGITLGLTDGSSNCGFMGHSDSQNTEFNGAPNFYGKNVGTAVPNYSGRLSNKTYGVTTDATKSGIETTELKIKEIRYFVVVATGSIKQSEMDWSQWASSLQGKANIDADNFSKLGKELISGAGMPSDRYIDLTLGTSGSTYIAPANGYYYLNKTAGADWHYIEITGDTNASQYPLHGSWKSDYRTAPLKILYPVLKGDGIKVNYNATGKTNWFRFIYAEGEV